MKHRSIPRRRPQRGVALIEVLVGILIFSIGVLGLIGIQTAMTSATTQAKMRAEAMLAANEVVGIMWADRANITQYNNASGATSCGGNARCADWVSKVASTLPSGSATITATAGGQVTISISWSTNNEGTHTYAMVTSIL